MNSMSAAMTGSIPLQVWLIMRSARACGSRVNVCHSRTEQLLAVGKFWSLVDKFGDIWEWNAAHLSSRNLACSCQLCKAQLAERLEGFREAWRMLQHSPLRCPLCISKRHLHGKLPSVKDGLSCCDEDDCRNA